MPLPAPFRLEKWRQFACALFICELEGEKWRERLRFRDYLRKHSGARRAYADLKRRLAQEFRYDVLAYQRAKMPFVQEILLIAGENRVAGENGACNP